MNEKLHFLFPEAWIVLKYPDFDALSYDENLCVAFALIRCFKSLMKAAKSDFSLKDQFSAAYEDVKSSYPDEFHGVLEDYYSTVENIFGRMEKTRAARFKQSH